ncbi:uncharacterized protein JKF63_07973 [Porcisia hertigi]|uniref:Uncharacterized protein n=1 Tax=Porcisia hertigi TaxID=2761500 RepID=A0A836L4P4_9TRYP|nr:hypothetical protein JKF63_07973 [Porcisia hertigi]
MAKAHPYFQRGSGRLRPQGGGIAWHVLLALQGRRRSATRLRTPAYVHAPLRG